MGEIAEMMLDGTMDPETGEWNFDGEDGPGFPMTGAQAAEWKRTTRRREGRSDPDSPREEPMFKVTKALRKRIEAFGELKNNDVYHWQVRKDGKVAADWWPHKQKFRIALQNSRGDENAFLRALSNRPDGA